MNARRQGWLVARREIRERSRSKGLWAGTVIMLLVVVAAVVLPSVVGGGPVTKHVGFTGAVPSALTAVTVEQGRAVDVTVRVHQYGTVGAGERAVRDGKVDALVVDARSVEWRGKPDERLRAVVTGAIQLVAVRERAAAAGINAEEFAALAAPVPVRNVQLSIAAGRSPDDETAAYIMSVLLLIAMATYGQLVLTGVAQEKSSRVVEVLLARMPARSLLAGKVTGIGLLGLLQLSVIAVAALVATMAVGSVDIPAISGGVLAWVVVWFVVGYALYAMSYGAMGSRASRTEDASSIAAPVTTVLIAGYWASLLAVSGNPQSAWAKVVSLFPATAPFAMPARIALGVTAWWEPVVAIALAAATVAGLVVLAGRVYTGAILRGGRTVSLRDAWGATTASGPSVGAAGDEGDGWFQRARARLDERRAMSHAAQDTHRTTITAFTIIGVVIGVVVALLTSDVIIGVIAGAGFIGLTVQMVKLWTGDRGPKARHP